jgi:membrane protease YdiL (CAAX protease family)
MKEKVFNFKEVIIIYSLIVISFFYSSPLFFRSFGIAGIPLTHIVALFSPGIIIAIVSKKDLKELYFLRLPQKKRYYFIGIGLWFLALVLSGIYSMYAVKYLPEEIELLESFDYIFANTSFMMQILIIVLIPSIVEELLFRGLIMSSLLREMRPLNAVLISSLLFASMHFSIIKLFPTFILGAVFGYVVYKSKSILPGILLHFVNNGLAVLGTNLLQKYNIDFENVMIMYKNNILILLIVVLLIVSNKTIYTRGIMNEKN